jgi:DNA polymerase (family 10)
MGGKAHGGKRVSRREAESIFFSILTELPPDIASLTLCGSYRRGKESCGDLDIVAIIHNQNVFDTWCTKKFGMQKNGKKPALSGLINDAQVEFYIATANNIGSFLQMWTGSAYHNVHLRKKATELGYSLSQYGLKCKSSNELLEFKTEEELYDKLNVKFKKPEER